jgi:hypothetical protein
MNLSQLDPSSEKAILTVFSYVKEIIFINWLPSSQSFDGAYFGQEVIISLTAMLQAGGQANEVPFTLLSRLVDKYMSQPPALSSGVRISWELISRVWTL